MLFNLRSGKNMDFYNFKARSLSGREVSLEEYKDKVVLVVNTASKCGFTPQLEGLQELYDKYSDRGFVGLGFPCNQFGKQDPNDVNGVNAHPLFNYLKSAASGILGNDIKWNFTKFLIDRKGRVVKRFAPITNPWAIEEYIIKLL